MNKRKGMAIVIVLSLSMFLLVLGLSYLRSVSQVSRSNPHRLKQVQAEFFARGIQKLAVLKFKALPADFYHAFRYKIEDEKTPRNKDLPVFSPAPMQDFVGAAGTVLQGEEDLSDPIPILNYTTEYRVNSSKKFDHDMIDIIVNVAMQDFSQSYRVTYDASRSLVLPTP
ncbi:MAG: hypothetical protein PWR01_4495 [Clostridiales bacterium]|nr:hypothetical protein [Clostridiales bacterium]MDN5283422.1 hypothetical protein [Candidatus Ozemobacter sp.]